MVRWKEVAESCQMRCCPSAGSVIMERLWIQTTQRQARQGTKGEVPLPAATVPEKERTRGGA